MNDECLQKSKNVLTSRIYNRKKRNQPSVFTTRKKSHST